MRLPLSTAVLVAAALATPAAARAQDRSTPPYTLQQVVALLEGGWAGADILPRLRDSCIAFRVTDSASETLRKAGADPALLGGLSSVCYRAESRSSSPNPAPPPPPAPRGFVLIDGELPAGWSRAVNELPPSINRRIDLTPGRSATIVVSAPGWCPDRLEVTTKPGEEKHWSPALKGKPWVGGC